jgi:hypothetical protein
MLDTDNQLLPLHGTYVTPPLLPHSTRPLTRLLVYDYTHDFKLHSLRLSIYAPFAV